MALMDKTDKPNGTFRVTRGPKISLLLTRFVIFDPPSRRRRRRGFAAPVSARRRPVDAGIIGWWGQQRICAPSESKSVLISDPTLRRQTEATIIVQHLPKNDGIMLKLSHIYFVAVGLGLACAADADEPRYVSDTLLTYIHSGPGNQYRIVGTLNSGDAVTLLGQNDDTGFAQIRDEKGRTAWIPQDQLSAQPSLRTRVPALEQQVQELTQKLNTIDASWNQRTADMQQKVATSDGVINDLKEQNQALKDQLSTAQKKVNAAVQLDDKQRTIIMQWFMYGGGVAGFGLLLGLLLPHIIPRRKKDNRWMN